ncbi:hypothetical protein PR202_gb22544 [Eleusine coracana subsp. coracana]|uniref:PIR2-like helical domain-containing protein n=1 Tax=Eleusine coracana subsp. coracana TaxID=191504 RepID=A0AAV5FDW5_ELECO|nr:hypothetical protein PR202_gb22544 [Eleusine coracana subsp. coracana]
MEAALTIAAQRAGHPAPEEVARITTARYPSDELSGIVAKLQGDELLTTADVWAIRELLSGQGAPLSDVKLTFLSRPGGPACNSDSNTHDGKLEPSSDLGNGFYAKVIIQKSSTDHNSMFVSHDLVQQLLPAEVGQGDITGANPGNQSLVSRQLAISRKCPRPPVLLGLFTDELGLGHDLSWQLAAGEHLIDQKYISDLTFDSTSMEAKLSNCLADTISSGSPASAVDYDASTCEHIVSLKKCVLDAIHAMYIKALAILPSSVGKSPFIRAILVAGHCYGPLDPVSNIILNSVWYKVRFPWHCDINRQGGIIDTSAMSRVESRSIDGLVAILVSFNNSSPTGTISRHRALETAKHPQCGALESFLMSLSDEKLNHIRSLLQAPCGTKL